MNVKEAMMDSVGEKLDLMQQGTRYDHYMELKEVFLLGIDLIEKMQPQYRTPQDMVTRVKLAAAVEVIDKRMAYLSDYNDKIFAVGREVRAAGIHRSPQSLLLTEGTNDDKQKKDIPSVDSQKVERHASDKSGPIKGGWPET